MNEKVLRIPYSAVNEDWNFLQKYLKTIGNPKYILVGNVNLEDKKDIFDLKNLVGVEGNFDLGWSSIETLSELTFVDGYFNLNDCENITTLGKLKKVEGGLNLENSTIESLSGLDFVGGIFSLYDCQNIKTLGKLKKVEGDLVLEYSSIESLGELEFVGKDLWIDGTKIPPSELNNVEVVGKIRR